MDFSETQELTDTTPEELREDWLEMSALGYRQMMRKKSSQEKQRQKTDIGQSRLLLISFTTWTCDIGPESKVNSARQTGTRQRHFQRREIAEVI